MSALEVVTGLDGDEAPVRGLVAIDQGLQTLSRPVFDERQ
jgi:hypothetical protein